ncbi:MAG: hypothetical protein ACTSWR_09505 [Candidatus Helarchaeota archaeon]
MRIKVILLIILLIGLSLTAIGLTLAQFYTAPIANISSNAGLSLLGVYF